MKQLISKLLAIFFILLMCFSGQAYAEYYVICNEPIPNVVTIHCKGHHCRWKTRHVSSWHYHTWHPQHIVKERNCSQDMATGDDNTCLNPDIQIN